MLKTLLATTALVLLPVMASAADMQLKAPPPVSAPVANWTGFYIGGTLGAGLHISELQDGDARIFDDSMVGASKALGFNIGGTIGYNWQVGSFVYGAEADVSYTNAKQRVNGTRVDDEAFYEADTRWFATARVRAGINFQNTLLYATGGVAWVNAKHTAVHQDNSCTSGSNDNVCPTNTGFGLVVGAGAEGQINRNWSLKFEYLYLAMKTHNFQDTDGDPHLFSVNDSAHIVRIGSNYRF